jgi:heme exporter protein A
MLLEATQVAIERGDRRLLSDVDLSVSGGEIWQLVGANGVGKTSLLRGLAGVARLGVTGEIRHAGAFLYLGHASALKSSLSPVDNLRWHPASDVTAPVSQICEALAAVKLAGYEYRPVGSLSAGQQRRVALARLLLSDAPLWLLDEPFTALDMAGCGWLEACVRRHVNAGGATVFTSHQPSRFGPLQQDLDLGRYAV